MDVARGALEELERINQDIPQIRIVPIIDTSDYIKNSIKNVGSSAVYGGLLAIAILLLFLRNIRSTVIIATAIPVSIIATFALLYFGDLTLNIMTLGGLALGIGMLVDNAIVVLENIYRLRERGESIERAAVDGADEVTAAVVASTLTTVVVFLPLVFMRGMSGVMFKQLSIVVDVLPAVLAGGGPDAGADALRQGPASGTAGRRRPGERSAGGCMSASGRLLAGMENGYRNVLHAALRSPRSRRDRRDGSAWARPCRWCPTSAPS